jgi:hypothetical protein
MNSETEIERFETRMCMMKSISNSKLPVSSSSSATSCLLSKTPLNATESLKRSRPSSDSIVTMESQEDGIFIRRNLVEKVHYIRDMLRPSKKSKYNAAARQIVASDIFEFLSFDLPIEKEACGNHVPFKKFVDVIGITVKSNNFWKDILEMEMDSTFATS